VTDSFDLERLRADARYARERRDLYRAKSYGAQPTDPARLRELERIYEAALARLQHEETQRPHLHSSAPRRSRDA